MAETETAISLMKMALALLDKARETGLAARLQHVISAAEDEPIPQTIEEAERYLNTPSARALLDRLQR